MVKTVKHGGDMIAVIKFHDLTDQGDFFIVAH